MIIPPAEQPSISIITVTYNAVDSIEECLKSVRTQCESSYEHVIIDGKSTDGTREILQSQASQNTKIKWLSESDSGIAEAMNKGIELAKGDWYLFLQGDDKLISKHSLQAGLKYTSSETKLLSFDVEVIDESGKARVWKSNPGRYWRKMPGSHQGMLFHKSIFEQGYRYSTDYEIAMDYDLVFRLIRNGFKMKAAPLLFASVDGTGLSGQKTSDALYKRFSEERRIHFSHSKAHLKKLIYHLYWLLYRPYSKMKSRS